MAPIQHDGYLSGKFLIAMPGVRGAPFSHSLVLLLDHSPQGAMGLIVNRKIDDTSFAALARQMEIMVSATSLPPVHYGGPIERNRGFVVHSADFRTGKTTEIHPSLFVTATREALSAIATGTGPARTLLALGYAGWGAGQLDGEIRQNAWLVLDPDPELVFGEEDDAKWAIAIRRGGIDPSLLSNALHGAGHA